MDEQIANSAEITPPPDQVEVAVETGPSNLLPQPTQDSIDLTGDSDDGGDVQPNGGEDPRSGHNGVSAIGLNGFSSGPSALIGNGNGNGHGHDYGQAGPAQQTYPSYLSKGPLRPTFGAPSFSTHPPNGQGNIHPPPNYFTTSFQSNLNNGNGTPSPSHFQSPFNQSSNIYSPRQPVAGPSKSTDGLSSSSAIDLTSNLPSPAPPHNPKKPIFIGAITTDVFMLYPSPIVFIGASCPDDKERLDIVQYRGAEFLKVKLKYRQAGTQPKKTDQWLSPNRDVVQVMTPGMTQYIGELNPQMTDLFVSHMSRGLLRLEGFAMRLQHDAHSYSIRINLMLFTLPANVTYISTTLQANNIYLQDPVPPYDPYRHADSPPYHNPHGGGHISAAAAQRAQALLAGNGMGNYVGQERISQVDVQRRQVDEVYTTLEMGGELEQSDPGPLIKTELFPHQRKALTFLLQREQDWSSLKKARKYFDKAQKKKQKNLSKIKGKDAEVKGAGAEAEVKNGEDQEAEDGAEGTEGTKESTPAHDEEDKGKARDISRSLWEPHKDDKGKIRMWKNKITTEEIKVKKGDKPPDCKGAILADDMGLGKTLSIVSLIAATRRAAKKFQKSELVTPSSPEQKKPELDPSTIKTKVFGMPDVPDPNDGKKRKRELEEVKPSVPILKSRGTLLVCPMSTITNWEDQIREHWNGDVQVIGGASGQMLKPPEKKWKVPKRTNGSSSDEDDEFDALKIYVYHGPSRCSDPAIIADFDIVITSYNTLANEYSKANANCEDTPVDTANNSDEEFGDTSTNPRAVKPEVEAEIKANEVADAMRKKKKGKGALMVKTPEKSPLQSIQWFRVALDEAHYIKTAATVASRAACAVDADRRIALTGTPIQNKIEDIWALFKFLRLKPIDEKEQFTKYISAPCKVGNQVGVARLQLVMRCCTLRRTKDSTADDGRKILNLPLRKESQMWLELREDERAVYDARHAQGKAELENFQQEEVGSRNYAHVLQQILRLRQTCNHVDLAQMDPVEEDYDGTIMDYEVAVAGIQAHGLNQNRGVSVVCFMKDGAGANCAECNYDYNDYFPSMATAEIEDTKSKKKLPTPLLLTKCCHIYCTKCFKGSVHPGYSKRMKEQAARACGICQTMLRLPYDVTEIVPPDSAEAQVPVDQPKRKRKRYVRPPGEKPNLSTKMQFLYDELMAASKKNPNSKNYDPFALALSEEIEELDESGRPYVVKSVVFSQWTTMLDRIGDMLEEAQIRYARLDGTMTREDRAKACDDLKFNKKVEILLVSTRAGGVGLNLTAASRCFLVDPYWNPSVEAQAIDRIHRMGQTRPVIAIKLMINNSVEQRLHKLQQKKANLAQISLNKLSRKDLLAQKAEELAELFK